MNGKLNVELQVCVGQSQRPAREYGHNGRVLIEGCTGSSFTLKIRNSEPRRLKAIVAVDGLNVVTGKPSTGDPTEAGYLVPALGVVMVDGWRTSDTEVAQFVFAKRGESYAAHVTATTDGGGVIGVAFVEEKHPEPPLVVHHHSPPIVIERPVWPWVMPMPATPPYYPAWSPFYYGTCTAGSIMVSDGPCASTLNASFAVGSGPTTNLAHTSSGLTTSAEAPPESPLSLGTAWGGVKTSVVARVDFVPDKVVDVVSLYYTEEAGLKALGIDVKKEAAVTFPSAFGGYCTPPVRVVK